jgi:hypothetical protein
MPSMVRDYKPVLLRVVIQPSYVAAIADSKFWAKESSVGGWFRALGSAIPSPSFQAGHRVDVRDGYHLGR